MSATLDPMSCDWCAFCLIPVPTGEPVPHAGDCITMTERAEPEGGLSDMLERAVEHRLLGRRARVTLARAGEPIGPVELEPFEVDDSRPRLDRDVMQTGTLVKVTEYGEVVLDDDADQRRWCWPALDLVPADLWTLIIGQRQAAEEYAFKRGLALKQWGWANSRGTVSWELAGGRRRPVRLVVVHGADPGAVSSPYLAREVARWKREGLWWE